MTDSFHASFCYAELGKVEEKKNKTLQSSYAFLSENMCDRTIHFH